MGLQLIFPDHFMKLFLLLLFFVLLLLGFFGMGVVSDCFMIIIIIVVDDVVVDVGSCFNNKYKYDLERFVSIFPCSICFFFLFSFLLLLFSYYFVLA